METTELLEILNGIFRKVLKRDDVTLTESTTAHDVDGWDSLTNIDTAHRDREEVRCAFLVSRDSENEKCGRSLPCHHE